MYTARQEMDHLIFPKFHVGRNLDPLSLKWLNGTARISLDSGSVNIWGTYNLEDIVTFSVGGKRAGKWQGRAVSASMLIPFAGRAIWK